MACRCAHCQIQTISEFQSGHSALFLDRIRFEQRVQGAIEQTGLSWLSWIPALDNSLAVTTSKQFVNRVELAAVVFYIWHCFKRSLEAALFQVESKYFIASKKEK